MIPREGFGWMNAAYQVGLSFLTTHMRRAVAACTSPEVFFGRAAMRGEGPVTAGATTDPLGLAMENMNLGRKKNRSELGFSGMWSRTVVTDKFAIN